MVILSRGPGLYSTKRLVEEAEAAGWAVRIIDPVPLDWVIDDNGVRIFNKGWPVECEAVLTRIGHKVRSEGARVVNQFESTGAIVINKSAGILNSHDKMRSCKMMSDAGIAVPVTAHVGNWEGTARAVNLVGGTPCVVKANEGTHGSGVFLAHSDQQARQLVYQMLERDMMPLIQEYIQESHGQDIRAIVVGDEVVAAMRRKAHGSEFRSNFHLGGSVEPIEISQRQSEIACLAAKTLGLDFAGVDMLESRSGPLVLEVNSTPGLEGVESACGKIVAGKVVELLDRKLREARAEGGSDSAAMDSNGVSDYSRAYD